MKVEDKSDKPITTFEPLPVERELYVAVGWFSSAVWTSVIEPDKNKLLDTIQNWTGVEGWRIYKVKVPFGSVERVE